MSGFTEAVTILKPVNDLAQKIIVWNDCAALLPKKNGFLSRYEYPQTGKKHILPYKPHQEYQGKKQPGFYISKARLIFPHPCQTPVSLKISISQVW